MDEQVQADVVAEPAASQEDVTEATPEVVASDETATPDEIAPAAEEVEPEVVV